jgi:EAL domain-containing protein (putative c-di-GMP-specific phosphodiesterase class I)
MLVASVLARQVGDRRSAPVPSSPRQLLRRALNRDELEVHYQPVFDAQGALAGAEALIRWRHPTLGLIDPGAILQGVHEGEELDELTALVLGDACRALGRLQPLIVKNGYLGVNIPAAILEHERLPQMVESELTQAGITGAGLVLELTETSEVNDWDAVRVATERLRTLGVRLALDDFGRGHSNLPALSTSNADIVKLDKALLDEVLVNERAGEIVDSVISLAASLQMQLVAEGIEDLGVLEWLMDRHVTYFQGYALGCPQPLDELVDGRYRHAPLPALAGLPHPERGSIAVPALISIALAACSLVGSAGAGQQWTIARRPADHSEAERLEYAYVSVLAASKAANDVNVEPGQGTTTASESDLVTVRCLELLEAIGKAHAVDLYSEPLERADWLAEPARRSFEAGNIDDATRATVDVVVPSVHRYLIERNGADGESLTIDGSVAQPATTSAPPTWAWLASASIAPAVGAAALGAWLLGTPMRQRRRFKQRHPASHG